MTKICGKCKIEKRLEEFNWRNKAKNLYSSACKRCLSIRNIASYQKNAQKRAEYRKRTAHKRIIYDANRYMINKDKIIKSTRKYYENNKELISKKSHKYYLEHKDELIARNIKCSLKRKETDINYRLACNSRTRLTKALKGNFKSGSAVRDLGCSVPELKTYLESKFYPNPETGELMTWDNWTHTGWHLDHIIPLFSFDLTDRQQFLKAVHYTNLQPLWKDDHFVKTAEDNLKYKKVG